MVISSVSSQLIALLIIKDIQKHNHKLKLISMLINEHKLNYKLSRFAYVHCEVSF